MADDNVNTRPTIRLVSPDGEVATVTDLNAADMKRRGWMEKADVDAAVEAQKAAAKIAEKLIAAAPPESAPDLPDGDSVDAGEHTDSAAPTSLDTDSRAHGYSTVDTYLESLDADALRGILLDKYGVKGHHKAGEESLIANIKEHASTV